MKARQKIVLDRILAQPVVIVLNFLMRVLGVLLRREHPIDPASTRSIAVSKFLGIGNILEATPALRALRQQFPNARLTFVTSLSNRQLIERLAMIDDAVYIDDRKPIALLTSTLEAVRHLIGLRIDHYFDLEVYSAFACLVTLFSNARNRFGFYRNSARHKQGIYTHLVYFNTRHPVREIYLQLARAAGCRHFEADELGPLQFGESDSISLAAQFPALKRPYVVVNANASDVLLERRWPAENFKLVIEAVIGDGYHVALSGSPAESEYVEHLAKLLPPETALKVTNTAGRLRLGELFALISGAELVITNDTGPMHMAIALNRPIVALFGPSSPAHNGFQRANVKAIYKGVYCSPCIHEIDQPPCHGNNICMKLITPTEVIEIYRALMKETKTGASGSPNEAGIPNLDDNGQPLGMIVRSSELRQVSID